jgi:fermentation-respiration switch protein FrsA (DUF1100 family)
VSVRISQSTAKDQTEKGGSSDFSDATSRIYDPSRIQVPVLLVHAEWDIEAPAYMSQAIFSRLTGAPYKRYVVIGEGTHFVMMERNRPQLFREVQLFLDENR